MAGPESYTDIKNRYLSLLNAASTMDAIANELLNYYSGNLESTFHGLSEPESEARIAAIGELMQRAMMMTSQVSLSGQEIQTLETSADSGVAGAAVELNPQGAQTLHAKLLLGAKRTREAADVVKTELFQKDFEQMRADPDFSPGEFAALAEADPLFSLVNPGVFDGGTGRTGPRFTPTVLANGDVWMFGDDGSTFVARNIPGAANKNIELDPRTGDLVSFNNDGTDFEVLVPNFGFAQIDPQRVFALEAQQTDIAFRGLELTARGQQLAALGQDMATQMMLGRMELEEATFQLNRINSAFDVRRQEREVALKFAIASTSIRTLPDGTRVFRSPLAEATARTLGLPVGALDLPVGTVNPEASAQALLDATQLDSPIPDLEAQAAATATATQALLDAPLEGAPNV